MFFTHYIFSKAFYTFWVACMMSVAHLQRTMIFTYFFFLASISIWVGLSGVFCILLPLWESRLELLMIAKSVATIFRKA
jgi:urea-proton symporter